jgi:hypothetical protein
VYNILVSLLHSSEIWTVKLMDIGRLKRAEIETIEHTAGCSLSDRKKIEIF